ncbi:hypothetical protein [Catenulispora subtropica]|uniref:Uncharacterized protein n=1 Tax=Catenulispora subtropica TaxID=450798 RepID=A0ABP5ERS0_9ACTN
MDTRTRHATAARDRALTRVNHLTWRAGTLAAAGAVLLGAGFAHLLPTHLPHPALGGGSSTGDDNSPSTGGGIQGPATAPGTTGGGSHVTSGGS